MEILESKQLDARNFWKNVEHPELGQHLIYPGAPVKLNHGQWQIRCRAPYIGEHNDDVYEKELGLSKDALGMLKSNNVI